MCMQDTKERILPLNIMLLSFICVISAMLAGCVRPEDTQSYMLAFVDQNNLVQVRWSTSGDPGTWENSVGGEGFASNLGVGAASEEVGLLRIIPFMNLDNNVEFFWGLGAAFDNTSSVATNNPASSAPSAVHLENADWLVAYRTDDDEVILRIYNHEDREWQPWNAAPLDGACSDISGRPALARLGNTIVMAGIWGTDPENHSIWIQVGEYDAESPVRISWDDCYYIEQPDIEGDRYIKWNLVIDPSLTHDHRNFYISIVEHYGYFPQEGDDTALQGHDLVIYRSSNPRDSDSWEVYTRYSVSGFSKYVNIAGRSDGSILAAILADDAPNPRVVRLKDPGSPSLDANDVFGDEPSIRQFALISVGHPPIGE